MNIFGIIGLCCCTVGIAFFLVNVRESMNGPHDIAKIDKLDSLSRVFIHLSEAFIVAWLLERNTGARIGYIVPLTLFVVGSFYGYLSEMTDDEMEVSNLIYKKIVCLAFGFLALIIVAF